MKFNPDDVVMRSQNNLFVLIKRSGVGINNTPWSGYQVVRQGDAERFVVDVDLVVASQDFVGQPVQIHYYDVRVRHGMSYRVEDLEDTERYIEILKEAVDFAKKIKNSDIVELGEWY